MKSSWKKFWSKLRPQRRKRDSAHPALEDDSHIVADNLPCCSRLNGAPIVTSKPDEEIDIHEIDKNRIRTTCKEALENLPEFPSREEVKEKIENAHKYYGVKCMYNYYSDDPNGEKELKPTWYYILDRPLVEQYVLMNNYIRKLSVMASLKDEQIGVQEDKTEEEEVSSISSLSDYEDFAPDSRIPAKLKLMKKSNAFASSPSRLENELNQLKRSGKTEDRTVRTNEFTIVIREPAKPCEQTVEVASPSSIVIAPEESQGLESEEMKSDLNSSGDHLPDMKDFDLSYNLVEGPVEKKTCQGRQTNYYHWRGNSSPTKTSLLEMDCQPPVRPRVPGTARDFMSFRNLSLSPEFVDSCRDYSVAFMEECRSAYLKELDSPGRGNLGVSDITAYHQDRKTVLPLTWEEPVGNCTTETKSIVESAVLACDYHRECNVEVKNDDDVSSVPDDSNEIEAEENVLGTSASQTETCADITQSESASSVETQILATPRT